MAVLLVPLIGFALILGKSDLAERGVKALVGTILVLSFCQEPSPGSRTRAVA